MDPIMAIPAEKMNKLSAYRKMKEETGLAKTENRRMVIIQMHDLISSGMIKNVAEMKTDLNGICSQLSSKASFKSGIGKEFAEGKYTEFMKSWDEYMEKYKSAKEDPDNLEKFRDYNISLIQMIGKFENVTNDYIEKRTDLWFRYVDNVSDALTAAAVVQVGISAFTLGTTAVTGGVTWCAKTTMKVLGKSIGKKAVKKALIQATKKKVAASMASKIMNSNIMILGVYPASFLYSGTIKGYAQNEMLRQGTGKAAISGMPIIDKEVKAGLLDEYAKLGYGNRIEALKELEGSVNTLTNPKGESTSEYMASAAKVLAYSYVFAGIMSRKKIAKFVMDNLRAGKKVAESPMPPGLIPTVK